MPMVSTCCVQRRILCQSCNCSPCLNRPRQLYAHGELLGGLDIMKEMKEADELGSALRPQA